MSECPANISDRDYNKEPSLCKSIISDKDNSISTRKNEPVTETDQENYHYEGEVCIYTDPRTKFQYIWSKSKNEWVPKQKSQTNIKEENVSTENPNIDYEFDGETYVYSDSKSGTKYKYDKSTSSWKQESMDSTNLGTKMETQNEEISKDNGQAAVYKFEGDTHTYTDPNDGSIYIWDREKNAWFPKVDEDFLAHYQMNYGFIENKTDCKSKEIEEEEAEDKRKQQLIEKADALKRKAQQEPCWFELDEQHNTKVYVSNLPLDITEEAFVDLMQKCGLVMRDLATGKMKIKLYTEPGTNQLKGDALCSYIKIESVDLALKLLDGYDYRGHKLHVEKAKFQMKGDKYNANLKPRKLKRKEKDKLKKMQEKLFDWRPDKMRGERSKHERVIIVKNLFDPKIFDNDVALILEYQQDLREECSKCGEVKKVVIHDRHVEGVAQITFREPEEADECVKLLNGRWFGQRKITAETWDGKTKYKVIETEEETQKRLEKWNQYLETEQKAATKNSVKGGSSVNPGLVSKEKKMISPSNSPSSNKHSSATKVAININKQTDEDSNDSISSSAETEGNSDNEC